MLTDKIIHMILVVVLTALIGSCQTSTHLQSQNLNIFVDSNGVIINKITDTTMVYCTKSNKKYLILKNAVCYEGGINQLKNDIYDNLPAIDYEYNVREVFFVYFDKNLNIIEVRATNLAKMENQGKKYLNDYIKAIQSTKGKWKKCKEGQKWYLYVFSLHIH